MEAKVYNTKGEEKGIVELPEAVYGRKPKEGLMHEAVVAYRANQRAGTAHAKTRAEVSGGGKKPWKQKGTGRARAGSTRSPIWRTGGVVFGPRNHVNWRQELPTKKLKAALASALSLRQADGNLIVVEDFKLEEAKTKKVTEILKALKIDGSVLFVLDKSDKDFAQAARNLAAVKWTLAADLNTYEALRPKKLLITKSALEALALRWS